jgi:4-hydroxybutyryl-CoA dehydratase / vinylacetyl-CoA-Delta-isomerase
LEVIFLVEIIRATISPEISVYYSGFNGSYTTLADNCMRVVKFLQHWSVGLHGPGTWNGAGAPQTQRVTLYALTVLKPRKNWQKLLW